MVVSGDKRNKWNQKKDLQEQRGQAALAFDLVGVFILSEFLSSVCVHEDSKGAIWAEGRLLSLPAGGKFGRGTEDGKEVGKCWLQHEQESSSLGPRLLAHSKAPLFPAQEFAACTTGRISQRKFAASVGGEECFKGLNGAFCWLVTLNGRRVLQATTCRMGSLCLLAQEDQPPQS